MEYSLLRKRARELKGSRRMNGKRHEDISIVERRDLIKGYIWGKRMHDNLIPVALFAVVVFVADHAADLLVAVGNTVAAVHFVVAVVASGEVVAAVVQIVAAALAGSFLP